MTPAVHGNVHCIHKTGRQGDAERRKRVVKLLQLQGGREGWRSGCLWPQSPLDVNGDKNGNLFFFFGRTSKLYTFADTSWWKLVLLNFQLRRTPAFHRRPPHSPDDDFVSVSASEGRPSQTRHLLGVRRLTYSPKFFFIAYSNAHELSWSLLHGSLSHSTVSFRSTKVFFLFLATEVHPTLAV